MLTNMILEFLNSLAIAGASALIAVTYRHILLGEPILSWWRKIGDRYERKAWFYPIVWGCHKCIAGQLALWTYLLSRYFSGIWPRINEYNFCEHIDASNRYSLISHLLAVCAAILFSEYLKHKYDTWN